MTGLRRAVGALALVGGVAGRPLAAQKSLVIERFDARITVERDGTLDVTETITARFTGSWNGLFRTIPVKYRTPQGLNWTLGVDLQSVTGADGRSLRVEASRERHYLKFKIWVPDARDATRTVVLRYRASNGLRFFDDHDELYWNVTGDEWEVPIEAASAWIELPPEAGGLRAIAFNGVYGSTARDAVVETDGATVRVTMPHRLEFHEGLTAVVGWNKGLIPEPTLADRAGGMVRSNWPLAIPVPVFLLMFGVWRRRGRDPRRRPIAVQYEPPDGLTPAEAGTLMDNTADMRDVTATLVDLAVRGFVRFEEREEAKLFGLFGGGTEYFLHRLKPASDWAALTPHERHVLEGVFDGAGDTVALNDLEEEFYRKLPRIKTAVFDRLMSHGFYRGRPDQVQAVWIFLGIAAGALLAVGGGNLAGRFGLTPVPFVAAGLISALVMMVFGYLMPARTEPGARALERVLGFEEFLRRVESDHMERVITSPHLFDAYLPFAMAFGVEKKWARAFEGIYTQAPAWYAGPGVAHFSAAHFSSRLSSFSTKMGETLSSSPRSSGGSGFSGGSSGGGAGGGGGGGF